MHEIELDNKATHETPLDKFDREQQAILRQNEFFEFNKRRLHQLFTVLGEEDRWRNTLEELAPVLRDAWVGKEHGDMPEKRNYSTEQLEAAEPILKELGLSDRILPPDGTYSEQIVSLGGTFVALDRRVKFIVDLLQHHNITTDEIIFLVGQRPRETRDKTDDEILTPSGPFPGNDIRENPWVQQIQAAFNTAARDETDLARIAIMKGIPEAEKPENVHNKSIGLSITNVTGMTEQEKRMAVPERLRKDRKPTTETVPERFRGLEPHEIEFSDLTPEEQAEYMPPQDILEISFEVPVEVNGETHMQKVTLLNGAAVRREKGPPRPTTASTFREYLQRYAPTPPTIPLQLARPVPKSERTNPRVMLLTGNPHAWRTAGDAYDELRKAGREDINLNVIATGTSLASTKIEFFLGEIAMLALQEQKRKLAEPTPQSQ